MATTGVGFRWLDILEKEFDKACVELDTSITELDSEDSEVVFTAKQKIATLGSCFAQLTHKALTIFQNSAKLEAELVDMRAELVQMRAASVDSCQEGGAGDAAGNVTEAARARSEAAQLAKENAALRETVLALHSELFGARLATKYLDKELAGRIQQLQLLGRDMRAELRDSLWAQVEAEILLQRHKTLVRVCRGMTPCPPRPPHAPPSPHAPRRPPRTVRVRRSPHLGLGISVTGGREHGVPILISELEAGGPAALTGELYVGDAILAINDVDLTQACHKEAVQALQSVKGDCALCVQFIATDDDDRLSEDNYRFPLYPEDGDVFCGEPDGSGATPTAPRTPEYNRPDSVAGSENSDNNSLSPQYVETRLTLPHPYIETRPTLHTHQYVETRPILTNHQYTETRPTLPNHQYVETRQTLPNHQYNNINNNLSILDMDDESIKIEARVDALRLSDDPLADLSGKLSQDVWDDEFDVRSASRRQCGPYRGLPDDSSIDSPHSTPVHAKRPSVKKKRKPVDWRAKGAYRAVAPDAQSSDEPPPEEPVPPASPFYPPSRQPSDPTPLTPSPPHESDNAPLIDIEDKSAKTNGKIYREKLPRRESKAFRIGSARRIVEASVNGEIERCKLPAKLLAGDGDPDFGTPV